LAVQNQQLNQEQTQMKQAIMIMSQEREELNQTVIKQQKLIKT